MTSWRLMSSSWIMALHDVGLVVEAVALSEEAMMVVLDLLEGSALSIRLSVEMTLLMMSCFAIYCSPRLNFAAGISFEPVAPVEAPSSEGRHPTDWLLSR